MLKKKSLTCKTWKCLCRCMTINETSNLSRNHTKFVHLSVTKRLGWQERMDIYYEENWKNRHDMAKRYILCTGKIT